MDLIMDSHNLNIINKLNKTGVLFKYRECYECQYTQIPIPINNVTQITVLPHLVMESFIEIEGWNNSAMNSDVKFCEKSTSLMESVVYKYTIEMRETMSNQQSNDINCTMIQLNNPLDYLLPFYILLVLLCLSSVMFYALLMMYRHRVFQNLGSRFFPYQVDLFEDLGNPRVANTVLTEDESECHTKQTRKQSGRKRIKSVDTFRGISVVLMVFVNYGGGQYWFMEHSAWNGLTVADLVFPWFVFIMGTTVALTLYKLSLRKMKKRFWVQFWFKGCKRSIILFLIGVALENPSTQLKLLRIMGPLQRLALAYFCLISVTSVLSVLVSACECQPTTDIESKLLQSSNEINLMQHQSVLSKSREIFSDIFKCLPYIVIAFGFLVAHGCLSLLLSVNGCPIGYMGPGGLDKQGCCRNCTGGVAAYIDRIILTPNHMYQTPTSKRLYQTSQPFDPEGILGNLTCIGLCFIGFWAGNVMLLNREWGSIIKRLLIYAIVCAGIGTGLCQGKIDEGFIPINKNLWSVSFVLVTAGTSFFLLAALFAMIDVFQIWSGAPFKYPGMNALVVYVGHILLKTSFPIQWQLQIGRYEHTFNLVMNVWGAVFWTGFSYVMYLKQMIITV